MSDLTERDGSTMSADEYFDQPQADVQADDATDSADEFSIDDSPGDQLAALKAKLTDPIPGGGPLLEEKSASAVFKAIEKEVKRQKRMRKNRFEAAKHWEFVKGGANFTTLEKSEDLSVWKQTFPLDVTSAPQPIPNKIADTCNKMRNQVLVDIPLPKPIADGDDDRARMASDLVKKFLRANATPDAMNDAELLHTMLDMNMTQASGFVFIWTDPLGGGWRPRQKKAHPQATDASNPMVGPKFDDSGQPVLANGQPITERTTDPILRYVAEDDQGNETFTENPAAAARQWMPALKRKTLFPAQVVTLPRTADCFTASGIVLVLWETLGEAKRRFEILNALSDDQLKKLCAWRPADGFDWQKLVPESIRSKKGGEGDETGELHDDLLLFWYHRFARAGADYMDGAEIAVNGGLDGGFLLTRDTLRDDVEVDDGKSVPILRRPSVAQFKGLNDTKGGDPFGLAPISLFGGANDIWAHLWVSILDAIDKALHPNVYIPATSPVTKEEYNRRDGTPIEILVPEDKPEQEVPAQLPSYTDALLNRVDRAINSLAGTNETADGLDSPYAVSGEAKKVAVNQAKVGLKQIWLNMMSGITYYWLICTEQAQAKYTVPQQVRLSGQDSAYKQRYFVGADLAGITKIAVEPGSGTMMSPAEKIQWLAQLQVQQWIDQVQAGELARASLTDDLGLPPNPHEEHINRCIGDWVEGPPNGWDDQYRQNMQVKQHYEATMQQSVASFVSRGMNPPQAQQAALQQVPPPQFNPLYSPFDDRPNDGDPLVAKIQASRLSRFMSTADYREHGPAWRSLLDEKYTKAFAAAGGQTVAQQQQAAQAQQAQASQGTDPSFQKFVDDIKAKVMGLAESEIAKAVAGALGAGPANPPAPTGADAAQLAADAVGTRVKLAHDAQQAQLDRAHQAAESAADRSHDIKKTAIQAITKAHNEAQRASLAPKPLPPVTADPAASPPSQPSAAQPALAPA